jgi:hypothetical protein
MTEQIIPSLRSALVTGIAARRVRTRRHIRLASACAAAVAVAVVAIALVAIQRTPDALAIERSPEWFTIKVSDVSAGTAAMNAELADAGINAEVRLVPVKEDRVGSWVAVANYPANGQPPPRDPIRAAFVEVARDELRIARQRDGGRLVLYAGRQLRAGETEGH